MPGFVTIDPVANQGGARNYGPAFLPAEYQGTPIEGGKIPHLADPSIPPDAQREQLDYILRMNRRHAREAGGDDKLDGLIRSLELAYKMQTAAPEVLDISRETQATQKMYGIGEEPTDGMGRKLLMARRLSEAGVRFVQVTQGGWDHHGGIAANLPKACRRVDKPIAALLHDLQARGLLDETLIYWSGEFGRTPFDQDLSEGKKTPESYGRGHHSLAYACWMAGGGIRGGMTYGETDEYGYRSIAGKTHLHDLHATILHCLGLDHEKLTYRYSGREFRLTDVYGRVVREILA